MPATPLVLVRCLAGAAAALAWSLRRVNPGLRARNAIDRVVTGLLGPASKLQYWPAKPV